MLSQNFLDRCWPPPSQRVGAVRSRRVTTGSVVGAHPERPRDLARRRRSNPVRRVLPPGSMEIRDCRCRGFRRCRRSPESPYLARRGPAPRPRERPRRRPAPRRARRVRELREGGPRPRVARRHPPRAAATRPGTPLVLQSGRPSASFPPARAHRSSSAPSNNVVGQWQTPQRFWERAAAGDTIWGGLTAAAWQYIGRQGVLQGTYEVFRLALAEARPGAWILTAGLGGMGSAQPVAARMAGAAALVVEVDPAALERSRSTGGVDVVETDLDAALAQVRDRPAGRPARQRLDSVRRDRRAGRTGTRSATRHRHRHDGRARPPPGLPATGRRDRGVGHRACPRSREPGTSRRRSHRPAGAGVAADGGPGRRRLRERQQPERARRAVRRPGRLHRRRLRPPLPSPALRPRHRPVPLDRALRRPGRPRRPRRDRLRDHRPSRGRRLDRPRPPARRAAGPAGPQLLARPRRAVRHGARRGRRRPRRPPARPGPVHPRPPGRRRHDPPPDRYRGDARRLGRRQRLAAARRDAARVDRRRPRRRPRRGRRLLGLDAVRRRLSGRGRAARNRRAPHPGPGRRHRPGRPALRRGRRRARPPRRPSSRACTDLSRTP